MVVFSFCQREAVGKEEKINLISNPVNQQKLDDHVKKSRWYTTEREIDTKKMFGLEHTTGQSSNKVVLEK